MVRRHCAFIEEPAEDEIPCWLKVRKKEKKKKNDMSEWMNEWWISGCVSECVHVTNGWMDKTKLMDGWMNECMDR